MALANLPAAAAGLVSPETLAAMRSAAANGDASAAADVAQLLDDARRPWAWGSVSGRYVTSGSPSDKRCHPESNPDASRYLVEGATDAYARALGTHLASNSALAAELAAEARERVLDLLDTHGFHGLEGEYSGSNQCILELALSVPIWIETARLLETRSAWSAGDAAAFRSWLASQVYPKAAWASRVRGNNWGAAGSLAAWAIASYVQGAVGALEEFQPAPLRLTPREASAAHARIQRLRIAGDWPGDGRCARSGIQPNGGIPEELRRGTTGCDGTHLAADDASLTYQTMHVELLVLHAELMRRAGDPSLYQLRLASGVQAILQAILFVIDNPPGSHSWSWPDSRRSTLIVAATVYDHPALAEAAAGGSFFRAGRTLPYAQVTHGHLPPDVEPPTIGPPGRPTVVLGSGPAP